MTTLILDHPSTSNDSDDDVDDPMLATVMPAGDSDADMDHYASVFSNDTHPSTGTTGVTDILRKRGC